MRERVESVGGLQCRRDRDHADHARDANAAGPWLLHRQVDIHDIDDNLDLGAAIIWNNLDAYHGDLVKALTDYYGGPSMVTDWKHLRPDAQRYVWGIYHLALAFQAGRGLV